MSVLDRLALSVAKAAAHSPRGAMFTARTMARLRPNLTSYPVATRYGPIVCDLRESVCHPLLRFGEYQHWREDEEAWNKLPITRESVVLDIGANIGITARMFAERAGHVHAFEPSPRALRLLRANAPENVTVHPIALGASIGTVRFAELEQLDMSYVSSEGIEVQLRTVDSLGLSPDFIKIDVEGLEPDVLKGASETLKRSPVVIFEALDDDALETCKQVILTANPGYRFEAMGGGTNFIAWPMARSGRGR